MPLPLAPLDSASIHRPVVARTAAIARGMFAAIGRGLAIQGYVALTLLACLLARLLFWPMVTLLFGCVIGVFVFGSQGWWWDVAQCVLYGFAAFALWTWLACAGEG